MINGLSFESMSTIRLFTSYLIICCEVSLLTKPFISPKICSKTDQNIENCKELAENSDIIFRHYLGIKVKDLSSVKLFERRVINQVLNEVLIEF